MSHPEQHHKISYIEFPTADVAKSKAFYSQVFGWTFKDWGPDYVSFSGAAVNGGFAKADAAEGKGALVVLYSSDLKATEDAVVAAGGKIVTPTFDFPGGRRFHFADGGGNVLAVWSE